LAAEPDGEQANALGILLLFLFSKKLKKQ